MPDVISQFTDEYRFLSNFYPSPFTLNGSMYATVEHWHDTYWGVCDGVGKNRLGQLLMNLRTDLRSKRKVQF